MMVPGLFFDLAQCRNAPLRFSADSVSVNILLVG